MEVGEVYKWKQRWHETFQHLLIGAEDAETSYIQTIWIECPSVAPNTAGAPNSLGKQKKSGQRAESVQFRTDHMIFLRGVDINQKLSEDTEGEESDHVDNHSIDHSFFASYYWFEFILFGIDGESFNICTWIFLEPDEGGIPLSKEEVFYKYFEEEEEKKTKKS